MLRDLIADYLRQGRAEGWTPKTLHAYESRLDMLAQFIGDEPVANIQVKDLERFIGRLQRQGWKRSSRRSMLSTIRQFFGWLADQGKVLSNPARGLDLNNDELQELPPPPLSADQVATLLDGLPRRSVLDLRNRAILELLYGCGLRLAELVALDLADIETATRTLYVREGKGRKERTLPLNGGSLHSVREYLALRRSLLRGPDHGALLLDRFGRRVGEVIVWCIFQKLNKQRRSGMPHLHPHLMRHSIAVHLLQNGADIRYVQQFLGHEKLDTTKIYLRLVPGHLKDDYEKAFPDIAVTNPV